MGEIRSSWQIAQEKADKLGRPSTEERKKQKEDEYRSAATALVTHYFDGRNIKHIERELNKYTGEDRQMIRHMLLDRLVDAIDLDEEPSLDAVFKAIVALSEDAQVKDRLNEIKRIYQECREVQHRERQRSGESGMKALEARGISGSAISTVNMHAGEARSDPADDMTVSFRRKLATIKKEIAR